MREFIVWWTDKVAEPYGNFLVSNWWIISLVILVVSATWLGKTYHKNSFDDWSDYWWVILFVVIITFMSPFASMVIVFAAPFLFAILGCFIIGTVVFFAAQNNFWIKRRKK